MRDSVLPMWIVSRLSELKLGGEPAPAIHSPHDHTTQPPPTRLRRKREGMCATTETCLAEIRDHVEIYM